MDDVLMVILINRLWPLLFFGICFIAFANLLSQAVEFKLSPKIIRLGGALLVALGLALFLYAYLNS